MTAQEIANKLAEKCAEQTIQSWLCQGNEISKNTTQTVLSTTALVALVEAAQCANDLVNKCAQQSDVDATEHLLRDRLDALKEQLTRILGDEFKGL